MPNTYIKPEKYVAMALAALYTGAYLPNVLTRTDGGIFRNAKDDTVSYRLPGITKARDYEWRTRTAPIQFDEIYRTVVDIHLDTHTYSGVTVTNEELTLDQESFASEVVAPQMTALRDRLESKVVTALSSAPFKITDLNAAEADDPYRWALGVRGRLNAQGTPINNRTLLVGTEVEPWILASDSLQKYDPSQAQTAFREATFGRLAGFDVVSSEQIGATDIYALHPSWGVLANVAPAAPPDLYASRRNYQGYSLMVLRSYDTNYLSDRSVLSTFTGISPVNDEYARYDSADETAGTIPAGFEVGDIEIDQTTGRPVFTGNNVRGGKGVFTPAA